MDLFKKLCVVSRPISWINTAFPFAAGYVAVTRQVDVRLIVGTLFFLIPYNLMMYGINDVFDYESDLLNPRKGGIEGAAAAKSLHRPIIISTVALNLPFIIALLLMGSWLAGLVLLLVVGFVLAYSVPILRFKERPVLDSITSSIHFVGPLVYALSLVGFSRSVLPLIIAFFCWGMASHAFGAVQDIIADRQAKISSIATVFGAQFTVRFAVTLYAVSCGILAFYGFPAVVVGIVGLIYIINVWPYVSITDAAAETANKAWRRFIYLNFATGFSVTMALIYSGLRG